MKQFNILKFLFITIILQAHFSFLHGNIVNDGVNDSQLLDYLIKTYAIQSTLEKENSFITVENPDFKYFVTCMVEDALEEETDNNLPDGLVKCYKQLCNDDNTFAIKDLLDALPSLITRLHEIKRGINFSPFLKPKPCDLSGIENALNEILAKLIQCCSTISADFNGTYSAIQDIKSTLTECCANFLKDFQETWTILNAGFNNTFSTLDIIDVDLTNCCDTILGLIFDIEQELGVINTTLLPTLQTNVNILHTDVSDLQTEINDLAAIFTTCCNAILELKDDFTFIACMASCIAPTCNLIACDNCTGI